MHTGLERLLTDPGRWLGRRRVALLTNQSAVDRKGRLAVDLLHDASVDVTLLLAPEHGLRGAAQDMAPVSFERDMRTGLPVISLYGRDETSLTPPDEALAQVDTIVFDIQDVGARYYTFACTLAFCMRAAGRLAKEVVVLDRPNPINGVDIEGCGLRDELKSFVGMFPIPQRHGMTVGELARLYQQAFGSDCALRVVECEGYDRRAFFDELSLLWVLPSPNMPTVDTAIVYPGMCLLEGTNLSEGRGTTRPFELFGAPFIDGYALASLLTSLDLPGALFRACAFEPTFQKHAGQTCGGCQLHVTERRTFLPFRTGLAVLWAVRQLYPTQFSWRREVYEFRDDVPAIDLLTGDPTFRETIDRGGSFETLCAVSGPPLAVYEQHREGCLLY